MWKCSTCGSIRTAWCTHCSLGWKIFGAITHSLLAHSPYLTRSYIIIAYVSLSCKPFPYLNGLYCCIKKLYSLKVGVSISSEMDTLYAFVCGIAIFMWATRTLLLPSSLPCNSSYQGEPWRSHWLSKWSAWNMGTEQLDDIIKQRMTCSQQPLWMPQLGCWSSQLSTHTSAQTLTFYYVLLLFFQECVQTVIITAPKKNYIAMKGAPEVEACLLAPDKENESR